MNVKLLSALSFLPPVQKVLFDSMFRRDAVSFLNQLKGKKPSQPSEKYLRRCAARDAGMKMLAESQKEELTLVNDRGNRICATLVYAAEKSRKFVILSHGYRFDGIREFCFFLPFYLEQQVNVLIVDHQAHGRSEGEYITFGGQESKDLIRWVYLLEEKFGTEIGVMLHGESMGAAAVLQAGGSPDLPSCVRQIVADCGFSSLKEQYFYCCDLVGLPKRLWPKVAERFANLTGLNPDEVSAEKAMKACTLPVLLIHGTEDRLVPPRMAEVLRDARPEGTECILVSGAKHTDSWLTIPEIYQDKLRLRIETLSI